MEQTESDQSRRGEGEGRNKVKGLDKQYEWPTSIDNSVEIDCGNRGVGWVEEGKEGKIDQLY